MVIVKNLFRYIFIIDGFRKLKAEEIINLDTISLTNGIFIKMGKTLQTFETIETHLKYLKSLDEDKE